MIIIALAFLSIYVLWLFYLAVMNLKRAKDVGKLTRTAYVLGLPILIIGYLLDALVNLVIFTIILIEIPKEFLVTARLSRLQHGTGWRASLAKWFCTNLLDQFDPTGCHCK